MEKKRAAASVRTVVEFGLLSGSLTPGSPLARMREGMLGHQARQDAVPDAQAEVVVRGQAEGETVILDISGRIDLLYMRDDIPVVEELKLAPADGVPEAAAPVHRAQAVCYGHMLDVPEAIIRVMYVRRDGTEVAAFEERLSADALKAAFDVYVAAYLDMIEARMAWMDVRDTSIRALPFPFTAYRAGQREMAVQAYWAIKSRKRLFAQAPTGTGKTAAALFPALKALAEGLTGQLFYLTARTTAQQNASQALDFMRGQGLRLRALSLTAKEKICDRPMPEDAAFRCDVLTCPGAIGFYDRLPDAMEAMRARDEWSREAVAEVAAEHGICPFEFGLSLCEEADAVVCDYNYAFDPGARIRRIFMWTTNVSLLIDEAHNLPDRARGMLSAELDTKALRDIRREVGKALGRKKPIYVALTELIQLVEAQPEGAEDSLPEGLAAQLEQCMDAALAVILEAPLGDLTRMLLPAIGAAQRFAAPEYTVLTEPHGRYTRMTLYCLDPAPHLREATRKLRGTVLFSATMTPLPAWRDAMGGTEEDGLLALPSPFPWENLLVLRYAVSTRYRARERTAGAVAEAILAAVQARPGNYLACFPSYAYLQRVREEIEARDEAVMLHVQRGGMDDAARAAYLEAFEPRDEGVLLGLVVMGGVFGEGVDLPGERLSGVVIVGVGLPQICPERELLRGYYDETAGTGFAQAYRYPGMNKVLQAVGRVIRTETDRGIALLIDDRFLTREYAELMPPWWGMAEVARDASDISRRVSAFWQGE